ncbi:MAG: hypothetical protein GXO74_02240 [Calditrichaeota bacterium]|nr:hypothetical protein [Calditrichota bacterium]
MKIYRAFAAAFLLVGLSLCFSQSVFAQTNGSSHEKTIAADTGKAAADVQLEGDIVLEDISIEAVIEKPRVSIVPKRMNPEFGELEFVDRSFDHELKSFPQKPLVNDDRLFKPQKINNIAKRIVAKKKAAKKLTNNKNN